MNLAYIRDGLPVLDNPVAGHVHVVADNSTTIVAIFKRGPDYPGDRVLRANIIHRLLDSWPTVASVLAGVLSSEQKLELLDILHAPRDASTWGPWYTAVETGAGHPGG